MLQVYIDLDSTLNRLHTKWLAAIHAELGEHIPLVDVTEWARLGDEKYQRIYRTPGFFADLAVEDGAVAAVRSLVDDGYEVFILSAAGPWNYADKDAWVQRHLPFIDVRNVIFATAKHVCAAPGRVLIDDGPHNIEAWRNAGGIGVTFDQPWNRHLDGVRLTRWNDLRSVLSKPVIDYLWSQDWEGIA